MHTRRAVAVIALVTALLPRLAAAQRSASPPATTSGADAAPSGEHEVPFRRPRRGARVMLNLRDADLMTLVRTIGPLTGRRFIIGRVHEFRATIYSPRPVTVAQAYDAFLAALESNGLTVVPAGRFYRIVERTELARQPVPVVTSAAPSAARDGEYESRVVHPRHLSAEEAAALLRRFGSRGGDVTAVPAAR